MKGPKMMDVASVIFLLLLTIYPVWATFQFENLQISSWKLEMGANAEETIIQICRHNASRNANICYNKEELHLKCGCSVNSFTENNVDLDCLNAPADCPDLRLTFQLGKGNVTEIAYNSGHTAKISWFLVPFVAILFLM
ncbi:uncharacterized protein LOC135943118 [Cloeon dipterum]|uniref:uncharacterized protein LOC135943118 n=1 Tax=Cloeon dipterum TaxID=197152 RepID=UPI00322054CA